MTLILKYGSMVVGKIIDPDDQDGTWFGGFESNLDPKGGELAKRLADYIAFCLTFRSSPL